MARLFILRIILLAILAGTACARAAVLWRAPEAAVAHDSGPGRDMLNGVLKRDDSSSDTLYFKFHVSPLSDATTEEYFAAFELFEGDAERLGIGNALSAYGYSAFFGADGRKDPNAVSSYMDLRSASLDLSSAESAAKYELPRRGVERTIVFKVQYVAGGDDLVTVWLSPDLGVGATEVNEPESLTTRFNADASFDEIRLRHGGGGGGWIFSDLAIATSFADFVDPSSAASAAIESASFFNLQRFRFDTWLREPGMPRAGIGVVAQTADGYLWLAGEDRVARFDGVRFAPLDTRRALGGGTVLALLGDSRGALWIGTREKGLARYADGEFETFTKGNGLPASTVTALAEGKEGVVWIGTTGGLVAWENGRLHGIAGTERFKDRRVNALCADQQGGFWIAAAGDGVYQYRKGGLTRLTDPSVEDLLGDPQSVLVDQQARVWVAGGDGTILCQNAGAWQRYRMPRQRKSSHAPVLVAEPDGTVWAGSSSEGLFQISQGKLAGLNANAGFPDPHVSSLLVDAGGNLWIGGGAGLHLLRRKHCFALGQAEGLGNGPVGSLAEVAPGLIWALQPGYALLRWDGAGFRHLTASGLQVPQAVLGSMLITRGGACWIASTDGLMLVRDPQAVADESQLFDLPGVSISSLAEGADGSLWAGTLEGQLWQLRQGRWIMRVELEPKAPVAALAADPDGRVWAGTFGGGLYLVGDRVEGRWDRGNGLLSNSICALHRDGSGALWIGTDGGGLSLLQGSRVAGFTLASGLPDMHVYGILEDRLGLLWLNDGAGLSCLRKPAITDRLVSVVGTYPIANEHAGDASREKGGPGVFPKGCVTSSGRLWFATQNGIVVAEPFARLAGRRAAALRVDEVLVDGAPAAGFKAVVTPAGSNRPPAGASAPIRIGPGRHRVELHYAIPYFDAPDKLRFRYRMEGLDPDWVEAGAARTAQYNSIPPGDYRFAVMVYGPGAVAGQAVVSLSAAAWWWQRGWVIATGSAGLLVAIVGAARYAENRRMKRRLSRLERENALERERTRIARDLHDEMGAKLCRISFLSEHAGRLDSSSGELKEQIATIAGDSRDLLNSLDEIVWVVNPQNDTLEHAASYITQYAENYFQGTGVACELQVPAEIPHLPVSSQTRHHLFLAVHEALTNVLKHSGADLVKVAISCEDSWLRIRVDDNGKGFAPPAPGPEGTPADDSGNGLLNMRQRMADIGGECRIESAPGRGTGIQFLLRLKPGSKKGTNA